MQKEGKTHLMSKVTQSLEPGKTSFFFGQLFFFWKRWAGVDFSFASFPEYKSLLHN